MDTGSTLEDMIMVRLKQRFIVKMNLTEFSACWHQLHSNTCAHS